MKRKIRAAFTLVELLIVIIIISILSAIAIPKFSTSWRSSSEARIKSNLKEYRDAIERFHGDTGLYPAALSDVRKSSAPANGLNNAGTTKAIPAGSWQGPYLRAYSSQSSTLYPDLRSLTYTYQTTSPNVGKVVMSSTNRDLSGVRYSNW